MIGIMDLLPLQIRFPGVFLQDLMPGIYITMSPDIVRLQS